MSHDHHHGHSHGPSADADRRWLTSALALFAARLAARPPSRRYTFGLGRAEILSAQANGASLLVLAGVLAVEVIQRLFDPPEVEGGLVIIVGVLGGLVNIGAAYALSRSERRGLNVEGAIAPARTARSGSRRRAWWRSCATTDSSLLGERSLSRPAER